LDLSFAVAEIVTHFAQLAACSWVAGMGTGIIAWRLGAITELHERNAMVSTGVSRLFLRCQHELRRHRQTWWSASVITDVGIAASMTYLVRPRLPLLGEPNAFSSPSAC